MFVIIWLYIFCYVNDANDSNFPDKFDFVNEQKMQLETELKNQMEREQYRSPEQVFKRLLNISFWSDGMFGFGPKYKGIYVAHSGGAGYTMSYDNLKDYFDKNDLSSKG